MPYATVSPHTVTASPDLARTRRKIMNIVCSGAWFDHCMAEFDAGRLKDRKRPDHALDRAKIYPPGGSPRRGGHRTLMRRCGQCKHRWFPPYYLRNCGVCEDCIAALQAPLTDEKTHVPSTESPSAVTFRLLEHYQIRLSEPRLPAEDEATLKRQIADYHRRQPEPEASLTAPTNTKKHV